MGVRKRFSCVLDFKPPEMVKWRLETIKMKKWRKKWWQKNDGKKVMAKLWILDPTCKSDQKSDWNIYVIHTFKSYFQNQHYHFKKILRSEFVFSIQNVVFNNFETYLAAQACVSFWYVIRTEATARRKMYLPKTYLIVFQTKKPRKNWNDSNSTESQRF